MRTRKQQLKPSPALAYEKKPFWARLTPAGWCWQRYLFPVVVLFLLLFLAVLIGWIELH